MVDKDDQSGGVWDASTWRGLPTSDFQFSEVPRKAEASERSRDGTYTTLGPRSTCKCEIRSLARVLDQERDVAIERFAGFGSREKELVLMTERGVVVVRKEERLDGHTFRT